MLHIIAPPQIVRGMQNATAEAYDRIARGSAAHEGYAWALCDPVSTTLGRHPRAAPQALETLLAPWCETVPKGKQLSTQLPTMLRARQRRGCGRLTKLSGSMHRDGDAALDSQRLPTHI